MGGFVVRVRVVLPTTTFQLGAEISTVPHEGVVRVRVVLTDYYVGTTLDASAAARSYGLLPGGGAKRP